MNQCKALQGATFVTSTIDFWFILIQYASRYNLSAYTHLIALKAFLNIPLTKNLWNHAAVIKYKTLLSIMSISRDRQTTGIDLSKYYVN